jgi:hypothetical protein
LGFLKRDTAGDRFGRTDLLSVDEGLQLSFDMDRWNSIRAPEEHIDLPMDLTFDIELRRAATEDDDDDEAA